MISPAEVSVRRMVLRRAVGLGAVVAAGYLTACSGGSAPAPTAADASKFLDDVNAKVLKLGIESGEASWVQSTYITVDTEAINAVTNQRLIDATKQFAKDATRFDNVTVPPDQRRQLNLLKLSLELVTPSDPHEAEEVTKLAANLEGTYGRGKWCKEPAKPATCMIRRRR